ncbi:MAG: hypothetical protein ACTSYD_05590 [Candidatus Heimdallarchaeaceae archaeon]
MSNSVSYYIKQLTELEYLIDQKEDLKTLLRIFNRLVGRIKRRTDLIQNDTIVAKICAVREKLFELRYFAPYSLFFGTIWLILVALVGGALLFVSLHYGIIEIFISEPTSLVMFIDHVFVPLWAQYIILGGLFLPTQLVIGFFFGIRFEGYYLGDRTQPCLKKNYCDYITLSQRKRILYYGVLNIIPFLWLAVTAVIIQLLANQFVGYYTLLVHFIVTLIVTLKQKRGNLYRFIRECKVAKQQKMLNSLYLK